MQQEGYARPIRLGMVGGGIDAFIGAVHRFAAGLTASMSWLPGPCRRPRTRRVPLARDWG
jgi:hypothetical protein